MQIKQLKRYGRLKMYYINTLKQKLNTAKIYEHNLIDERSVVDRHRCHMAAKVGVFVAEIITSFLRYTGYLKFIKDPTSHVLLLILAHALLLSCL